MKFVKNTNDFYGKNECQRAGHFVEDKPKKPSPTKFQLNLSGDDIISLSELKDKYKRDNTLNFWDFNIITTEVMIHISVKLGIQLLKGINHVFTINCGVFITSITRKEIRFLKAHLFMFKNFFDEFITGISNIHYFNIAIRRQVTYFVDQVNSFMEVFEDVEYRQIRISEACTVIEELLSDRLDAYRIGNTGEFLFDEFYFTDTINYIYNLYKFDV